MPDITMCNSKECPSRDRCYRHEATPKELQSWGDFDSIRQGADKCADFVGMTNEPNT